MLCGPGLNGGDGYVAASGRSATELAGLEPLLTGLTPAASPAPV